jgi:S1-C subfamily serine protease
MLARFGASDSSRVLAQAAPTSNLLLNQNGNFVTAVVEKVGPAVVRIDSARTVTSRVPEAFNNPLFRQFFGDELPSGPRQRVERGEGSGLLSAIMVKF